MNSPTLAGDAPAALPGVDAAPPPSLDALRDRIREERRTRPAPHHDAEAIADVALEQPEIASARCVAAYVSAPNAPGTLPLRRALTGYGVRVLLPVLLDDGDLNWAVDGEEPMADRLVPDDRSGDPRSGTIGEADAVIIPALAVDTLGRRLGQGRGFYERTLQVLDPGVPVFALVFESEVYDAAIEPVPAEVDDRRIDAVLTPARCLRLTGSY